MATAIFFGLITLAESYYKAHREGEWASERAQTTIAVVLGLAFVYDVFTLVL